MYLIAKYRCAEMRRPALTVRRFNPDNPRDTRNAWDSLPPTVIGEVYVSDAASKLSALAEYRRQA